MRSVILLACAFSCISFAAAQTRINVTMEVDSVPRQFILSKPSGAPPATGYPIVFMFHGTSGDGEKFYNISGWKELGEAEGFISVFPSSLEYRFFNDSGVAVKTSKWKNAEALDVLAPGQYMKDDVRFVRTMIDTIASVYRIDRGRIYASGFSNGGCFVSKLAVEMSDVFAAIAPASGPLLQGDSARPARNIPLAVIIGSKDDHIFSNFGVTEVPFNDTGMVYFSPVMRRYTGAFGLSGTYTTLSTPSTLTYLYKTPAPGASATEFSFTLVKDMKHEYPNGTNYPLSAAQQFWTFFKRNPLVLTDVRDVPAPQRLSVYPNPASDWLVVEGSGEITLNLYSLLGQRVFSTRAARGESIRLPQITRGMYRVEVSESGRVASTIMSIR
jgi:polyhydroxybutyrate depolymerase